MLSDRVRRAVSFEAKQGGGVGGGGGGGGAGAGAGAGG
jgi:hypothetical protein